VSIFNDMTEDETFVPATEAAQRLGITDARLMELVNDGTLRSRRQGGWLLEVQPALIPGVTTSATTAKRPTRAATGTPRKGKPRSRG
jgi:hypothetical protein